MKFYNPFKPHLAVNALGEYSVRFFQWKKLGWMYIDKTMAYALYETDIPGKSTKEEAIWILEKHLRLVERGRLEDEEYYLRRKTKRVE